MKLTRVVFLALAVLLPASHAKVTIVAPSLITPREAYRLFLDALDSVGLTVLPAGPFLRIIESAKAKSSATPVVGFDGYRVRIE